MKGSTYTKTLAKIQVKGIFRIRDIRKKRFTQIYHRDVMLLLIRMSSNMADGNQQKLLLPSYIYV